MPHDAQRRTTDFVQPETDPSQAYAADLTRLQRVSIGALDDAWLILAHALWRLPMLTAEGQRAAMPQTADALAATALAVEPAPSSASLRVAGALRAFFGDQAASAEALAEVVFATQSIAEEIEIAGGYALAYALLAALDAAFATAMTPRMRGNIVAHQGRTMRQLGQTEMARSLYTAATEQGYECDAKDVVARGQLGLAILAMSRGNYPAARELYERSLANADVSREHDLLRSAHHGLMNCGFASGDLDEAMVHGWNVLRLCIHPDARAEALMNMAEICRLTGEHDIALRVFMVTIEWSSVPRVRLHAMSSALQTAIVLQKHEVAARFLRDMKQLMPLVADTFALASTGVELAESLYQLGDREAARRQLADALTIARTNDFHEQVHLAEQLHTAWENAEFTAEPVERISPYPSAPPRTRRSAHFKTVLRSLNGLAAATL